MPIVPNDLTAQRHGASEWAQSRTEHQPAKLMPSPVTRREERAMSQVIDAGQPSDERRFAAGGWGVASRHESAARCYGALLAAAAIGVKFFAHASSERSARRAGA